MRVQGLILLRIIFTTKVIRYSKAVFQTRSSQGFRVKKFETFNFGKIIDFYNYGSCKFEI